MKTKITLLVLLIGLKVNAQTITYANFSSALTGSFHAAIANQSSFNLSLTTTVGSGVTWNAAGITQQIGTPTISFIYGNPASTPNGGLFPNSNYVMYDPALTSLVSYDYINHSADSIVRVGQYEPSTAHEIYTNPDKNLIFPFTLNQSFIDTYAKTNYSDATTISSFQTGTRTVTYTGFGTLILPQGTFTNVALISELRTNSLGPDSPTFTWYEVSSGKQLLFYSENNGSVTVAYNPDLSTGTIENNNSQQVNIYPNPASDLIFLSEQSQIFKANLINPLGQSVNINVINNSIDVADLSKGLYFIEYTDAKNTTKIAKFLKL